MSDTWTPGNVLFAIALLLWGRIVAELMPMKLRRSSMESAWLWVVAGVIVAGIVAFSAVIEWAARI